MGLFDKLRNAGTPNFDPQRAIMTIVVAAVKADGAVSEEEIGRIRSMCVRSPIFANNTKEEDDHIIDFADTVTEQLRDEAIVQAAKALKPEIRETAFAFACDIMLADGIVTDSEEQYLMGLAAKLSLSNDVIQSVVHATVIRNRSL